MYTEAIGGIILFIITMALVCLIVLTVMAVITMVKVMGLIDKIGDTAESVGKMT